MARVLMILDDETSRRTTAKALDSAGPLSPRQQGLKADLERWISEVLGEHDYELRRSLEPPPPAPSPPQTLAPDSPEGLAANEVSTESKEAKPGSPRSPPSTADPPPQQTQPSVIGNEDTEYLVFIEWSLLQSQTSLDPSSSLGSANRSTTSSPQEKLDLFLRSMPTSEPNKVRIFLLLPETAESEFHKFRALPIADIFSTPIDPSLFKQKLQFWSAPEGKKVSPEHLFRRASQQRILLGKDVVLDQINEIRGEFLNPRRLKRGKIVWLHAAELGPGRESRLAGRVIDVEPEGSAYRISLRWIGITSTQLKSFRRLMKDQRGRQQKSVRPAKARLPNSATISPAHGDPTRELMPFHLAIIDPDPMSAKLAASSLEEIAQLRLQSFPSVSRFLRRFSGQLTASSPAVAAAPMTETASAPASSPSPPSSPSVTTQASGSTDANIDIISLVTAPASLWKGPLQGRLRLADEVVLELKAGDTESIEGQSLDRWCGEAKLWEKIFAREDLEEWQEQLRWLSAQSAGQSSNANLKLILPLPAQFEAALERPEGAEWQIQLRLEVGQREATASFEIQWSTTDQVSVDKSYGAMAGTHENSRVIVDAVAVDLHLLGDDAPSRALKLRTLHRELESRQIFNSFGRVPPLIVLVDEKLDVGFEDFESLSEDKKDGPAVVQIYFHRKVYDRHLIAQLFLDVAPDAFHHPAATRERLTSIHMPTTLTQAYPSTSLAEYGLELEMPFALQRGAGLRVFSDALEFGDLGVWVKCVGSGRQSDGTWINEFVFFGSVERIQQKLRAWIRQEYAKEKAAQTS
jgi:hypothetical protein